MRAAISILLFIATVFANTSTHIDTELKNLTLLITEPLYQLKEDQIQKILQSHLHKDKKNVAMVLIDEFNSIDEPMLSLWKEGYKKTDKNLLEYSASVFHPKSKREIGTLFLYKRANNSTLLTQDEIQYLKQRREITLCIGPNSMPFEDFDSNGNHIGLTSDYYKIFQEKLKVPIRVIKSDTWTQSIEYAKQRKCDLISAMETAERRVYLDFTTAFIQTPIVLATKQNVPFVDNFSTLTTQKIGGAKGYTYIEVLKEKYPNLTIVEVETIEDGLQKVKEGKLFGQIGTLASVGYFFQKKFTGELKITGKDDIQLELGIGVRNDDKMLLRILQKEVDAIDATTHYRILNNWISIKYGQSIDYALIWKILSIALLIVFVIIYWNMQLKKEIKKRHLAESQLKQLNNTLEQRVASAIEEIHHKELIMHQQSRLAQMGEMISMIAHQWRQPLSATSAATITMLTKIRLKKFDLDKPNEQKICYAYMEDKLKSVQGLVILMSNTIEDFRNFFKKERTPVHVTIQEPIEKALHLVMPNCEAHQITISRQYESLQSVDLYQNEVMQVILNLLKNAKDAFEENASINKKITIHTYDSGKNVVLEVCDNAGGVLPEIANKIFDPYFSTKDAKNGTGLGLYMSKMIIEDHHNGTLDLINKENGACFVLTFKTEKMH